MLDVMTPQEKPKAEAFTRTEEWARLQRLTPRIGQEFREIYQAKQNEVMAAVAKPHQAELQKAVDAYRARIQKTELLMAREKQEIGSARNKSL